MWKGRVLRSAPDVEWGDNLISAAADIAVYSLRWFDEMRLYLSDVYVC